MSDDKRIKRGAICADDYDRLFIVVVDEQKSMSWNGDFAGNAWAGTCLLDGASTLCVKPKFVAASFRRLHRDLRPPMSGSRQRTPNWMRYITGG